jgi:hypothetical protein
MALKMGAADFVGEVANSNPVVSTITSFLCFEQLTAEPIFFIANSTRATLVDAVDLEESLSVSASPSQVICELQRHPNARQCCCLPPPEHLHPLDRSFVT